MGVKTEPAKAGKKVPGLRISARPQNGFWRAGVFHPAEPVDHPASRFKSAQLRLLRAERNLIVVDIEIDAVDAVDAGGPADAAVAGQEG